MARRAEARWCDGDWRSGSIPGAGRGAGRPGQSPSAGGGPSGIVGGARPGSSRRVDRAGPHPRVALHATIETGPRGSTRDCLCRRPGLINSGDRTRPRRFSMFAPALALLISLIGQAPPPAPTPAVDHLNSDVIAGSAVVAVDFAALDELAGVIAAEGPENVAHSPRYVALLQAGRLFKLPGPSRIEIHAMGVCPNYRDDGGRPIPVYLGRLLEGPRKGQSIALFPTQLALGPGQGLGCERSGGGRQRYRAPGSRPRRRRGSWPGSGRSSGSRRSRRPARTAGSRRRRARPGSRHSPTRRGHGGPRSSSDSRSARTPTWRSSARTAGRPRKRRTRTASDGSWRSGGRRARSARSWWRSGRASRRNSRPC